MRHLIAFVILLASIAAPAAAQTPSGLPQLPDTRPPPLELLDESVQPQVTISLRDGDMVEEHRVNGKLYRITVTPEHGVPYTLVDQSGDGTFTPLTTQGSPKLSVPMWVIGTF